MKPILSIAIPTYGAPRSVLNNVKRLLNYKNEEVEFLVIDNDDTGEQLKEDMLQINDCRFHYYQNEENIGRSKNVARAVEKAKSDNVLLLSSDDHIFFDALDEIVGLLKQKYLYGIILGTIITDNGGYGFIPKSPGVYSAGSEALKTIPFLGNLMPMVVNKKCIDFEFLYKYQEHYMQLKLALLASKEGDLIYLNHILGEMSANENSLLNNKMDECFSHGYSSDKWDMKIDGNIHYSPEARLIQLKNYLEIVENCSERRNLKLQVVEKWVSALMSKSLFAIAQYMSPFSIKTDGYLGHLHYKEVLEKFQREMNIFFQKRESAKEYFFSGHLNDLVNNELLLLEQSEYILDSILQTDNVLIYGNGRKEIKLKNLLKCMGIHSEFFTNGSEIAEGLVLVPAQTCTELEKKFEKKGAKKILFMDGMTKYLGIVWCSRHEGEKYWNEYVAYMN